MLTLSQNLQVRGLRRGGQGRGRTADLSIFSRFTQ
jgi:hypothetical protein